MVMPLLKANVGGADFRGPNPTSYKTCGSQHSQSITVGIKLKGKIISYNVVYKHENITDRLAQLVKLSIEDPRSPDRNALASLKF